MLSDISKDSEIECTLFDLQQWLFFTRLFADLAGRLLPRLKRLALRSQGSVLALGMLMLALTPLFYLYIALAPPWLVSDALACGERFSLALPQCSQPASACV